MEGAKKRIFGVFEAFFDLYTVSAAKTPQTRHFVKFCGVFAAAQIFAFCVTFCVKILRKWCRKNAAGCGATKTSQNLTVVFVAFLRHLYVAKNLKITKSVYYVVGRVGASAMQ